MPDDSGLHGYKELSRKLSQLGQKVGGKVLRGAMFRSTTPVIKIMRAAAPVGRNAHRTYKGRLVAPGFLRRSMKRVSRVHRSGVSVRIGVRREAFYGIQFLDQRPGRTPYRISKRGKKGIRPYSLSARPWFSSVFERESSRITKDVGRFVGSAIERLAKR